MLLIGVEWVGGWELVDRGNEAHLVMGAESLELLAGAAGDHLVGEHLAHDHQARGLVAGVALGEFDGGVGVEDLGKNAGVFDQGQEGGVAHRSGVGGRLGAPRASRQGCCGIAP